MSNQPAHLYWLILGCEAAFWLLLVLALVVRYVLRRKQLSRALLFALPAVDMLLLATTALDLRAGTPATFAHGLATAYVGFTITSAVSWLGGLINGSSTGSQAVRRLSLLPNAAGPRFNMNWRSL